MPIVPPRARPTASQLCDVSLFVVGILVAGWATHQVARGGWDVHPAALLAVPLIVVVAHFPVVTDQGEGGIEVGFDSAILMFLVCTLSPSTAVVLWSLGVLLTQLTSRGRRPMAVVFNIGVGIVAGAVATVVFGLVAGDDVSGPRELLAVLVAAAAYFASDFVLSGFSIAIELGGSVRESLVRPGSWLAVGWFVPFDLIGYLGAVVHRTSPWWMLLLLAVPLATLLVATRAITHGRENARRLQLMLDAAVESQTLSEPHQITDALLMEATRLLRLDGLEVRGRAPAPTEIGAALRGGDDPLWIVGPARRRARSTPAADARALTALAAVSAAALTRLALTEDLVHLARFDPLTDLPNRAVFLDRLNYALLMAARAQHDVALLFIDLDGFKPVNDRFGHAAGDAVLVDVGRRLRTSVREDDLVARLGGDEFAVLFEGLTRDEVDAACRRILAVLSAGVETADHVVHVSASIGVAWSSEEKRADRVLRNADLAMYEAKSRGKNRIVVYEPGMLTDRLDRLELVEALSQAVAEGGMDVAYQPVVAADTGEVVGVEALARWRHLGALVPPDVFIPLAEQTGMIHALGRGVLDRVALDAAAIREAAGTGIDVAVNVSPTQLVESGFEAEVAGAVARMGGSRLVLEITEREGISHDSAALATVERIAARGVRFAIDDFGVGFSSLNYLREVPAEVVKIDASLVQNIDRDPQARSMLQSITVMARTLGYDVVIEGVERESQLDVVRRDVPGAAVQGFLLHRPMPREQLLGVLRAGRPAPTPAGREDPAARVGATPGASSRNPGGRPGGQGVGMPPLTLRVSPVT